jgi:hypothetical protein
VQLRFGRDDLNAFASVKTHLLDEFRPWADEHYGADDGSLVADADTFLSWRVNYSTGDLSRFTPEDAEEFLLDWAPRKFAVGPDEAPVLCRSVQAMIEFLAVTGRLDGGVATAARVMMHVDDLVDDVAEALGADSNFGIGKSLGRLVLFDADGNELTDLGSLLADGDLDAAELQAALEQRMEAFNSLPFEQRRALTDAAFAAREPEPVELLFTYVSPPVADVDASAARSKLLDLVDRFVEFVAGDNVKLTDAGNISMGGARRLVAALETGDVLDHSLLGRPTTTRSSTELRWLTLIDDVATSSGAVERLRTKLRANDAWRDLPISERAIRMVHGVLEAGPLRARIAHWDDMQYAHRELLDDGVPHWLSQALPEGSLVDYSEIEELAIEVTQSRFDMGRLGAMWPELVASRLSELFEVLELAEVITWHDLVTRPDDYGVSPMIVSGSIWLTPMGRAAMVEPVRQAGYTFATIDDLADADGLTLVNAVASGSLDEDGALAHWRPDSSTLERARLLVDAAVAAAFPVQRLVAFDLLGRLEPLGDVGPVVRELLDTHCSGYAATFLLEHSLATEDEVAAFVDIGPFIDMIHTLVNEPADLFRQAQEMALDDLIEGMWRHDQPETPETPETPEVLEALGRHLTDKQQAKAVRKAVIKHRSWLANR